MTGETVFAFIAGLCAGSLIMDVLWRFARRLADELIDAQHLRIAALERALGAGSHAITRTQEEGDDA